VPCASTSLLPVVRIEPRSSKLWPQLRSIWEYRELLLFLTWRDVKVRYRQTALGIAWAVLQPAFMMVVLTVFFGYLAHVPSDNSPYMLFALCGLLPWQLFSNSLTTSANSVVANERLVTRVYFPRLILPIAAVLASVMDFAVALPLLFAVQLYHGIWPGWRVLMLPAFVFMAVASALAVGIILAALNVRYRDVRYTLPFLTQLWMFATPIAYPSSIVPARWQLLYGINPMTGPVEGLRWCMLGSGVPPGLVLCVSVASIVAMLVIGIAWFWQAERTFADVI
jgi:lipopolysaccharide transport system permease protein